MASSAPSLEFLEGGICVLTMRNVENRFNPNTLKEMHAALDQIEKNETVSVLIITAEGKFFSNGLDLDWMGANGSQAATNIQLAMKFLARYLVLPFPTIAAINGHAFAAGCMLALTNDFRIMRKGRGFICLPEVDIHMGLTPGMNALIVSKIADANTRRDAILLGKRFTAEEAQALRIVDTAVEEGDLRKAALELASRVASKGKDRGTFGKLKSELYERAFQLLDSGDFGKAVMSKL
eukprot:TRINITY_DN3470_c0_g1_i1.p1 TRINITY_DN3470_c0_g1~~TRINITY_DN3470_c0_g1_i1.p1  ORF type:complete len:265 (+),score=41.43 TRINITY_DN3470_c0_g1_i1:87-797(+)